MNEYETARRNFLKQLGLTVGAALVTTKMSATILNDRAEFKLTPEQSAFMERYEKWMDEFIPAIQAQHENEFDMNVKKRIVELSEQSKQWQSQLAEYMKDENFARYYMTVTERMTKEIY